MKNMFLNFSTNLIKKYYPNYDEIKIAELRYGLEALYLTITKMIIIFILAVFFNIVKEMLLLLIIFNILRTTGFGLHATKSYICLISSSITFIGLPLISKYIVIPIYIKLFLAIVSIYLIYKYAPADTKKRPLINKKKRNNLKIITTINTIILNIIAIIIKDYYLSNLFIFGIWIEIFLISPFAYNLFHLSYNNYKNYKLITD